MKSWRFIKSPPATGAANMRRDEKIFKKFVSGKSLPVLRFYRWSPPAISVGRFQNAENLLDMEACCSDGIEVVKRITGGGAIYHGPELTYSISCSHEDAGGSSIREAYFRLCSFIIKAYKKLGLDAGFSFQVNKGPAVPAGFCFSGLEKYDIVIEGLKIGGNAQRRCRNTVFQHGSIPFDYEEEKIKRYFKLPVPSAGELSYIRKYSRINYERFSEILKKSFSEVMNAVFKENNEAPFLA